MTLQGLRIHIRGIVQGVGFRPFVFGLAKRHHLNGWVRNTSAGVEVEVDGERLDLDAFLHDLSAETPALAHIDTITPTWTSPNGYKTFEIHVSKPEAGQFIPISPDVSLCADCLRELFDPGDRRYRYPFINCTNCGPRFTIIKDIPYDRPNTTMAGFPMCPDCAAEYHDPLDRRFHAQPVACPVCGPQVWLELVNSETPLSRADEAILAARQLLLSGKILAIKGLGGFHLACDATNAVAVAELRRRKLRVDKPFAVMVATAEQAVQYCQVSPCERQILEQRERPIVILLRHLKSTIAEQVAPGQNTIGLMLPYTPLHYLLFAKPGTTIPEFDMPPLVMTSGNLSEEPICIDNDEARERLASLADAFLLHDRPIHIRCDDSVVRMFPSTQVEELRPVHNPLYPLRRSRGFAPDPVRLDFELLPLLATGAELKNTFCLTRQQYVFLSQHIGDLENLEALASFEQGIAHYERLFRIQPQAIACDLHPDYLATRYAQERGEREGLPVIGIQHHHAHIVACMAENGLRRDRQVIGVAFDGTGYGDDDAIWGGEFLLSTYQSYQRVAHLKYVLLPGGDKAVREPWRMALSWLEASGIRWEPDLAPVRFVSETSSREIPLLDALRHQLQTGLNAPQTSSMGRLFDAVAALAGVRQTVNYEAQAAIEFEALADVEAKGIYPFDFKDGLIDPAPAFHALLADLRSGATLPQISVRFHTGVAAMVKQVCISLRQQTGIAQVALSGGVWQNILLLSETVDLLQGAGFEVYLHRQAPTNDGGLALGQAVAADACLKNG